ncbi:MAG TPA: hypothetical protein VKA68_05385 [bacterium]|nr:hypothetical protein [bacterium]
MKQFFALLRREFLEWRTVFFVVTGLYLLLLILLAYGSYKVSNEIEQHSFSLQRNGQEVIIQFDNEGENPFTDDREESARITLTDQPSQILEVWGHVVRGLMVGVNFLIVLLAIFYLADAVYKERSDTSTFYYRSLPVSDTMVLGSKLVFGTVGILLLSFVLSTLLVLFVHLIVPGRANAILLASGLSLSQFQYGDLIGDWAAFHLLQLLWLSPFALYFLLVSTLVKNRPLLTAVGVLILLALIWKYLFSPLGIPNQITLNFGVFGDVLDREWLEAPRQINSTSEIELFGSFWPYVFTWRTLIALGVSGVFGWMTHWIYRKNIEVS